ncbi:MAG: SOS response-associated peptidase [Pseudomonadota bacterium]
MCGRYVITITLDELRAIFGEFPDRPNLQPSWNAAPTQNLPVIRAGGSGEPRLSLVRWGLVPHWSRDGPAKTKPLINARCETAAEKPTFRQALSRRRALIPANGFYEWSKTEEGKQPWYITRADGAPMVFAGLWERWGEGASKVDSFAILTAEANNDIAHLHHRCPVMIAPQDYSAWLDRENDPQPFLKVEPDGVLTARKVSNAVNAVRNDRAELLDEVE